MQSTQTFNWPVRVYYEDTDAGGVVYHAQYLNFMERARTEMMRHLGFEHTVLLQQYQYVFVVHSLHVQYKKSAKLDDLLEITCTLSKIGYSSVEFLQTILLKQQTLVAAQIKLACVDEVTFKPISVPPAVKKIMQKQAL